MKQTLTLLLLLLIFPSNLNAQWVLISEYEDRSTYMKPIIELIDGNYWAWIRTDFCETQELRPHENEKKTPTFQSETTLLVFSKNGKYYYQHTSAYFEPSGKCCRRIETGKDIPSEDWEWNRVIPDTNFEEYAKYAKALYLQEWGTVLLNIYCTFSEYGDIGTFPYFCQELQELSRRKSLHETFKQDNTSFGDFQTLNDMLTSGYWELLYCQLKAQGHQNLGNDFIEFANSTKNNDQRLQWAYMQVFNTILYKGVSFIDFKKSLGIKDKQSNEQIVIHPS